MNLRETLLDATQHFLVPVDLQVRMQAALHKHARAAEFHGFANLVVDGFELEDIALFGRGPLQRPVESAEGAILGAEIRVIDVAIDDVGGNAFRVKLPAQRVSFHADADEVVGTEQVEGLLFGQGHSFYSRCNDSNGLRGECQTESRSRRLATNHLLAAPRPGPVLVPIILDESQNPTYHRESNQQEQCWFVVSGKEPDDMPAINRPQAGHYSEANRAAQRQRGNKLFARILHGACRQQKWHDRKRWRQQGRDGNRAKSPALESFKDLCSLLAGQLALEGFLAAFPGQTVGDVAAEDGANRGHERVVPPQIMVPGGQINC